MATTKKTTKKTTTKKTETKQAETRVKEEKIEKVEPKKLIGIVNTEKSALNVREVPEGKVVKTLPKGSKVEYLKGADPDWYQLADGSGFILASKIK